MTNSTPERLQALHQAITAIDFEAIFAYHEYDFGAFDGGCWLIAKAIQNITGGHLHYLATLDGGLPWAGTLGHVVVEVDDDEFMDGHGYQTLSQLEQAWAHLEPGAETRPALLPLFFLPQHLERNAEVVKVITGQIQDQLDWLELSQAVARSASEPQAPVAQELKGGGQTLAWNPRRAQAVKATILRVRGWLGWLTTLVPATRWLQRTLGLNLTEPVATETAGFRPRF